MEFQIKPYEGVGLIQLGMTSDQIQKIMSEKPKKFKKFSDDEYDTDAYETFFVYYKSPGICEAIEFFKPSMVSYNGVRLLEKPYSEIKEFFKLLDADIEYEDSGLTSYKYGIGIYAPFAGSEPMEFPEGIIVFEKGYYDY